MLKLIKSMNNYCNLFFSHKLLNILQIKFINTHLDELWSK